MPDDGPELEMPLNVEYRQEATTPDRTGILWPAPEYCRALGKHLDGCDGRHE